VLGESPRRAADPDHFTRYATLPDVLAGMDEARIDVGITVGRSTPTVRIENDTIAALAIQSEGRLIGVASVDPVALGRTSAVAEAERVIKKLGLGAINLALAPPGGSCPRR
jgi:predicted TIM-barrel fold metal-dependent hydrolase